MAPLWFASATNQQMAAVHQHSHPVGPPPRMPPNNIPNVPAQAPTAPYQRGIPPPMQGQRFPPGNHMPPRGMPPMQPMGGPLHHMGPGKGRPFVSRPPPPNMRMSPFGVGDRGPHRGPPPNLNGRMGFPHHHPNMHRPMPPQQQQQHNAAMMHRGMHLHQVQRQGPMGPPMGPPRMQLQGPMTGAPGPMSAPQQHQQQHPPPQAPLRELRNQNIQRPHPQALLSSIVPQKPPAVPSQALEFVVKPPAPETAKKVTKKSTEAQDAATDAAEILLGLRTIPSPPPPMPREERLEQRNETPSLSPDEPICLPTRLAVCEDESKLNSMHCFLRSDLLELFVVERSRSPKNSKSVTDSLQQQGYKVGSASGRVGLRCVHCAKARLRNLCSDGEAPMAVFYPKSISELYRLVTSWQRVHLRKCRNLPPAVREIYETTRQDKSRGKTQWWVTSAQQIGLVDCTSKAGGIRFSVAPNGLSP
jgi:hypothetical protein